MKKLLWLSLISIISNNVFAQNGTITISGQVTDFDGNPTDSCWVALYHNDFSVAYGTFSDKTGHYVLSGVEKGEYMCMYAIRLKEYPRNNAVPEEEMRLEFWAWNVIADRNLVIHPRYQKLEIYGTNVFRVMGGYPGFFIYFRPMSVTKYLACQKENHLHKKNMEEKELDLSVRPEYLAVRIFADDELLKINSITPVEEYCGITSISGYLVQVEAPRKKTDKPYILFRVEAENKEFNEKGENLYFYELKNYK